MGGGFTFRLQQVLELRQQQEQQVAAKLAEAETVADEARMAHEAIESIRNAGAVALRAAHAEASTIGHLNMIGYVIEQIDHHVIDAQSRVDVAEQAVSQARTDLTSALQARRVLTRLRERHHADWQTVENSNELKTMDELALARFARRDENDDEGAVSA